MSESLAIPCFLDTCVYCGYAYKWDSDGGHCGRLFNSGSYLRNTSLTVKDEIDEICRDFDRFLRDVAKKGLNQVIAEEQNPSRKAIFEKIAENLCDKDPGQQYSQLRMIINIVKEGFLEAMSKTCKPLIARSSDYLLIESLYFIGNRNDAQILGDAIAWSRGFSMTVIFFTKDNTHILKNSEDIKKVIRNSYNERPNIDFKHVSRC